MQFAYASFSAITSSFLLLLLSLLCGILDQAFRKHMFSAPTWQTDTRSHIDGMASLLWDAFEAEEEAAELAAEEVVARAAGGAQVENWIEKKKRYDADLEEKARGEAEAEAAETAEWEAAQAARENWKKLHDEWLAETLVERTAEAEKRLKREQEADAAWSQAFQRKERLKDEERRARSRSNKGPWPRRKNAP